MKQIYTLLLSSILGCSPAVTKIPASEPIHITSTLGDLATGTYRIVNTFPDKMFPPPSEDALNAVDYGNFMWFVQADEEALLYTTKHKLFSSLVTIIDLDCDGRADSALDCLTVLGDSCAPYDLQPAQVLYEKMLRDTPTVMAGKNVAADQKFINTYMTALPEKERKVLRQLEEKEWGVKGQDL